MESFFLTFDGKFCGRTVTYRPPREFIPCAVVDPRDEQSPFQFTKTLPPETSNYKFNAPTVQDNGNPHIFLVDLES